MNKKNIESKNNKGQYHGYQEWYEHSKLYCRTNTKNGLAIDYNEYHDMKITRFFIK